MFLFPRTLLIFSSIVLFSMCPFQAHAKRVSNPDPSQLGRYAVGHTSYVVANFEAQNRQVAVSVFYPAEAGNITSSTARAMYPLDPLSNVLSPLPSESWESLGYDPAYEAPAPASDGPFPLLMVSVAWQGSAWMYIYFGTRLASHGYVVAVVEEFNDGQWPWLPSDPFSVEMLKRTQDVPFVLTDLLAESGAVGGLLKNTIDDTRIAISGHSLGGYGAYALTVGDDLICDATFIEGVFGYPLFPPGTCVPAAADPRIKALVSLDGASYNMKYEELARVRVPSLLLGETVEALVAFEDIIGVGGTGIFKLWEARPHAAIDRRDSYRVDIVGTNHFSYMNACDGFDLMNKVGILSSANYENLRSSYLCPADLPDAVTHEIVTTYTVAFLNTHLRKAGRSKRDMSVLTNHYAKTHNVQFFRGERCHAARPDKESYFTYRPHPHECVAAQKDPAGWFANP